MYFVSLQIKIHFSAVTIWSCFNIWVVLRFCWPYCKLLGFGNIWIDWIDQTWGIYAIFFQFFILLKKIYAMCKQRSCKAFLVWLSVFKIIYRYCIHWILCEKLTAYTESCFPLDIAAFSVICLYQDACKTK